jgi:2-hydroxy fatty acid dioxygenase
LRSAHLVNGPYAGTILILVGYKEGKFSLRQACNTPNLEVPAALEIPYFPFNLGTIVALVYATLYILMEPVAGIMVSPIIIGGIAYCNHLIETYGAVANKWAIAINVVSWIAQFIGHGVFEGRAPALLDNLIQAFFLAPFFVWFEVLFFFGYRPELKSRLNTAIEVEIKKFKETKDTNTANGESKKTS